MSINLVVNYLYNEENAKNVGKCICLIKNKNSTKKKRQKSAVRFIFHFITVPAANVSTVRKHAGSLTIGAQVV